MVEAEISWFKRFSFSATGACRPFFADFACHRIRLAIEIDGETYTSASSTRNDILRSDYFRSQGYRVIRFWNNDVMNNIEGVMTIIQQTIGDVAVNGPPPLTPPRAVRGRRIA